MTSPLNYPANTEIDTDDLVDEEIFLNFSALLCFFSDNVCFLSLISSRIPIPTLFLVDTTTTRPDDVDDDTIWAHSTATWSESCEIS